MSGSEGAPGASTSAGPSSDDECPFEADDGDARRAAQLRTALRTRAIRRVFLVTLGLNLLVAGAKSLYAAKSGSVTIGADALHSLLDGGSNVLALVGLHFGAAPADAGHPYGHRKFEILAALGVGILIALSLVEIASAAIDALAGARPPPTVGWGGFAVVLGTMAINAAVSRYEAAVGRALDSPILLADARHTQSDLFASAAVLVSFIAARIGQAAGWPGVGFVDGVGGLLIAALIGRVAWHVIRENVPALLDAVTIDPGQVRWIAGALPGVAGVHRVRSRGSRVAVEIDLHVEVAPEMTVRQAHDLADAVEAALRRHLPNLSDVIVHIEPSYGSPPAPTSRSDGAGAAPPIPLENL